MNDWHTSLSFQVNQPPSLPQIRLFQTLTLKLQGQGHRWGQRSRSHNSPGIQPMHLLFVSHQSDQPFLRYLQLSVWPWKNTSKIFKEKFGKKGIMLPSVVVIGWVVLILSYRQANLCLSISQPWPWVKVTKRSSSTFSQTYTFFVPNIWSSNSFDVRSKSLCGGGGGRGRGRGRGGGNELKT